MTTPAKAGTLLEAVARARDARRKASSRLRATELAFTAALVQARRAHSWRQIAKVAGITYEGVRWRVLHAEKGEEE